MDANFSTVFPDGVTVGCADELRVGVHDGSSEVDNLPAMRWICSRFGLDPRRNKSNANRSGSDMLEQRLCVSLVDGENFNVAFWIRQTPAWEKLLTTRQQTAVRTSQALAGYSLGEIIEMSDAVLGGCSSVFTPNQLRKALRDYNQNFDNGVNLGRFRLPGCESSMSLRRRLR